MVAIDIQKTFGTVWLECLLQKLIKLNTPDCLIKILNSYLTNRKFFSIINDNSIIIFALFNIQPRHPNYPKHINNYVRRRHLFCSIGKKSHALNKLQTHINTKIIPYFPPKHSIHYSGGEPQKNSRLQSQLCINGYNITPSATLKYLVYTIQGNTSS